MIDVYFCTAAAAEDELRAGMASVCLTRWGKEDQARIGILATPGAMLAGFASTNFRVSEFQKARRVAADVSAQSDIYVVADDDCLAEHKPFLTMCAKIMERHPDYAVLALWPNNSTLMPWTPPDEEKHLLVGGVVHEDDEVMEHVSVGGIRFCRKGALKEWPPLVGKTYDSAQCAALRTAGYRSGFFKRVFLNHLGRGYSTVWTQ